MKGPGIRARPVNYVRSLWWWVVSGGKPRRLTDLLGAGYAGLFVPLRPDAAEKSAVGLLDVTEAAAVLSGDSQERGEKNLPEI